MISGAGGNWRRFDEKFDASIIKQTTGLSCVSAVGEMLLRHRGISVTQGEIRQIIGEPADFGSLARALNHFDTSTDDGNVWRGITTDNQSLDVLFRQKNWAIILCEPLTMGHAVLVDGQTRSGLVRIKDPFDQTSYKMKLEDFLEHWGGQVILRWFR
jgi:filamentous hemagglutinin